MAQIGKCLGIRLAKGFLIHKAAINGVGIFSFARVFAGDYNGVVEKLDYLIIAHIGVYLGKYLFSFLLDLSFHVGDNIGVVVVEQAHLGLKACGLALGVFDGGRDVEKPVFIVVDKLINAEKVIESDFIVIAELYAAFAVKHGCYKLVIYFLMPVVQGVIAVGVVDGLSACVGTFFAVCGEIYGIARSGKGYGRA